MIVANKTIDDVRGRKEEFVILKVDFEKAYDYVNWDFLVYMMRTLGFYSR